MVYCENSIRHSCLVFCNHRPATPTQWQQTTPLELDLPITLQHFESEVFTLGTQYAYRWLILNIYCQRLKFLVLSLLYNGYVSYLDKREIPLRKPFQLLGAQQQQSVRQPSKQQEERSSQQQQLPRDYEITSTDFGSVTRLVTPDLSSSTSAAASLTTTDTLHISLLRFRPNCEMPSQVSPPYAEFYYVISGSGLVSQQGIIETMEIEAGCAFVVDPLSMRWISSIRGRYNGGDNDIDQNGDELVLLRVTDGGSLYSKSQWNQFRLDPNHSDKLLSTLRGSNNRRTNGRNSSRSGLDMIARGLAKVQLMALEYAESTNSHGGNTKKNGIHPNGTT